MNQSDEILNKCIQMRKWVNEWRDFDLVSWYQEGLDELEDLIDDIESVIK